MEKGLGAKFQKHMGRTTDRQTGRRTSTRTWNRSGAATAIFSILDDKIVEPNAQNFAVSAQKKAHAHTH